MGLRHRGLIWGIVCGVFLGASGFSVARGAEEGEPEVRTWTDSTGKFRTEAAMVDYDPSKAEVHLLNADGQLRKVPLNKLSDADRRYLRKVLGRRRAREKEEESARMPAEDAPSEGAAAAGGEWPGWRGANRDGRSSDTGLLKEWPAGGPELAWKLDGIGKGFSGVAVAGGLVYITGDVGNQLTLFAYDLDGKPQWQREVDAAWTKSHPGSRATPTIDGGNLYLISGGGGVGCFDARTGKPKWACQMGQFGGSVPGWGYSESVLIYDNLAVVTPGGENCIVALDKTSGNPVWSSRGFRAGAQYSSCYAFTHEGVPMIVNGTQEGIVCVDAKSGQMLWSNPFSAHNTANCPTPVYADGHVFWANGYGKGGICIRLAGNRGGVVAEQAWTTQDMVCHHGGYIIDQGYIYGNNNNGWACLELRSGRKMWEERAVGKGSVCYADGMLYLFSENGGRAGLATCSPDGLEMRGEFSVQGEGPSWAHPVVTGGRLYLRYDTNLYCFDVRGSSR